MKGVGEGVWYHIGHLAADTDGDSGRYDVGKELCEFLNGGDKPWWHELLHRETADTVRTPHGCRIRATGPMIDRATPPSWGIWQEDETADGQIARGLAIERLLQPSHFDYEKR